MTEIIYKEESYKIVGACMSVHAELGSGFLEAVYQEALEKEFTKSGIPFRRQVKLNIFYQEEKLKKYYRADFLCYEDIVVELKVAHFISKDNYRQLLNYLNATKKRLGILVNFGTPSLTYKRVLNSSAASLSQNSL